MRPLIIDSFAGGGGASTGIEMALGRGPDVAINHSAAALALHAANHPETIHLDSNIWFVDPRTVAGGRPVGLLWASPDCKHFSKAKGGAPRDRNIRDLAWVIVRWAEEVRPDVIIMENVEEFVTWGPLDDDGEPIKWLAGQTFELWIKRLKKAGYRIQYRELRACDYGAPTIRKRFFLIARRDGRRIVWPKPTHGDPRSEAVCKGKLLPWRTAAEIIDWSLPCPSIFASSAETGSDLRGPAPTVTANSWIKRPGGASPLGLLAPLVAYAQHGGRARDIEDPLHTVTASSKDQNCLIAPHLMTMRNSGKPFQGADEPTHTITAGGAGLTLVAAGLVQTGYGERPGQAPRTLDVEQPLGTVVAGGAKHAPFAAFLAQQNGGPRMEAAAGRDPLDPLSTLTGTGSHQTPIAAWLAKWYGAPQDPRLDEPLHTITTKPRFDVEHARLAAPPFAPEHEARARQVAALLRAHSLWDDREFVSLEIDGAEFVIVDIGLRMLTPRELYRAQGFPADYVIEGTWAQDDAEEWAWRPIPKDVQISCVGNSVCPPLAAALVDANCAHLRAIDEPKEEVENG